MKKTDQILQNLLINLGFSDKETVVYLALLELDTATASKIALKASINRTTSYDILTTLTQKGLVNSFKKGGCTYYNSLEPNKLITYLDNERNEQAKKINKQKKQVEELLPMLISLQKPLSKKPKVKFFEGEKGMREAYEDTLSSHESIRAFANVQTMHEGLPNFFPEYYKRRTKAKIAIRAIIPNNKLSLQRKEKDAEEIRQSKILPQESMTFSPEINIYDNKMLIASWQEKMAVIIESQELADLQKLMYDIIWEKL